MNRKSGFYFVLLLIVEGLAFGANLFHEGSVSVDLPFSEESSSVWVPGVLAAIQTAGSVLAPAGFVTKHTGPGNTNNPSLLAVYTRNNSVGTPTTCNVFLRNGRIVFSFVETGIPHSSYATVHLCNKLADALRARFGTESVEVQFK